MSLGLYRSGLRSHFIYLRTLPNSTTEINSHLSDILKRDLINCVPKDAENRTLIQIRILSKGISFKLARELWEIWDGSTDNVFPAVLVSSLIVLHVYIEQ